MAEPARSDVRPGGRPDRVVRPLSRAATRRCARPGCPTPATATLTFGYEQQHATLGPLVPDGGPETYDLCSDHADRTRPPHGWTLRDDRPEEVPVEAPDASALGSERTVAVLAAALRGQPTAVPDEVAVDDVAVDVGALDAITAQPFDEPDLFGVSDEADPAAGQSPAPAPGDALSELSALSGDVASAHDTPADESDDAADDEIGSIVEQVPARTVPGAHRPD